MIRAVMKLQVSFKIISIAIMNNLILYWCCLLYTSRKAILTYINNQVGAQVPQGTQVAVISDLSHFKVEGEIADTMATVWRQEDVPLSKSAMKNWKAS